jgi:hypothetical protein
VLEPSCNLAVDQLIAQQRALSPDALIAALDGRNAAVTDRLFNHGAAVDDYVSARVLAAKPSAYGSGTTSIWSEYVLDDACAPGVRRAIAEGPRLAPHALVAAIAACNAPVAARLLADGVRPDDDVVTSALLADGGAVWRHFALDASCAAVATELARHPALGAPALIAAISAFDVALTAQLLEGGAEPDERVEAAAARTHDSYRGVVKPPNSYAPCHIHQARRAAAAHDRRGRVNDAVARDRVDGRPRGATYR